MNEFNVVLKILKCGQYIDLYKQSNNYCNTFYLININIMSGSSKDIDYKAGKKRWPAYLFLIVALQGLNIVSTCLCIYAIITLNWQLCLILATIIFLQSFIRRS